MGRPYYGAARGILWSSPRILIMPVREGCSFSIRIADGAGVPVNEKTSELVPIGKPRTFLVRGFSMIRASDSEAHTDGRAFLFAEHHTEKRKGRNQRPPHVWGRGWLRNRCVSESSI